MISVDRKMEVILAPIVAPPLIRGVSYIAVDRGRPVDINSLPEGRYDIILQEENRTTFDFDIPRDNIGNYIAGMSLTKIILAQINEQRGGKK